MLRYFYKGALHGLVVGMLGCGIIAAGSTARSVRKQGRRDHRKQRWKRRIDASARPEGVSDRERDRTLKAGTPPLA
jgi:hypothetical protein